MNTIWRRVAGLMTREGSIRPGPVVITAQGRVSAGRASQSQSLKRAWGIFERSKWQGGFVVAHFFM